MSYHDRQLKPRTHALSKRRHRYVRAFLRGVNDLTLTPTMPIITLGSVGDDWRAVGDDMRGAITQLELCE